MESEGRRGTYSIFMPAVLTFALITSTSPTLGSDPEVSTSSTLIVYLPPTSSVNEITPYWQTLKPFVVTATASSPVGHVENVALWYRRSTDNLNWSPWAPYSTDNLSPWEWSFDAPLGDGYYEFYSIATDNFDNQEPAPLQADARCGVDTTPPITSSIEINGGESYTSSTEVNISIRASDATSGLDAMQFSDDGVNWSSWEPFAASKAYTLPAGDGTKTVYIRVRDRVGFTSSVASDSIILYTVLPPKPKPPSAPEVQPEVSGLGPPPEFVAVFSMAVVAAFIALCILIRSMLPSSRHPESKSRRDQRLNPRKNQSGTNNVSNRS